MDKYVKVKPLGKGSFGSAILIRRRSDNQLLVVKEVNLSKMSSKEREEARNECKVLQQLNHPNIVRYVEHYEHNGTLYIIMEYADGGDLAGKIKDAGGRGMPETTIMYFFSQLCLALEYLHSRHILHRDIKTMNIFLMKNGAVKLGDFGISTVLRNTMGMANTVCGTPYYFSPELCKNKPYNNRSDVWAMGVVLYELMTGKHPFDGNSMHQLMQRIVKNSYPAPSSAYTKDIRQLLDLTLQKEPMRRPTIKQLLAHPCVRGALEKLETDLMLATQCRIRLQDIIDFPVKGSGKGGRDLTPPPPPVTSLQPVTERRSDQQVVAGDDPRRAPRSTSPQAYGQPPQAPAPQAPQPQRNAAINNLKADLERVDAFINQLNKPVNDRAKDAIQEYMKRKQEELVERKKREAEMQKKQEERNAELKRIMEDHQKQMLEAARQRQQRFQQQLQNPMHQQPHSNDKVKSAEPAPPSDDHKNSDGLWPARAKKPAMLQNIYNPTPRRQARQVIAANSPRKAANANKVASPQTQALVKPAAAVQSPGLPQPPVPIPKHQMVEKAQNWVDKQQAERRRSDQMKKNSEDERERRLVRELDGYAPLAKPLAGNQPHLPNRVIDPELDAWVRKNSNVADAVVRHSVERSMSPQSARISLERFERDDLPAGVDARKKLPTLSPQVENLQQVQQHANQADQVLRQLGHRQQGAQRMEQIRRSTSDLPSHVSDIGHHSRPRTPERGGEGFRRHHVTHSEGNPSSRTSSPGPIQNLPGLSLHQVPDALDQSPPDYHTRTNHVVGLIPITAPRGNDLGIVRVANNNLLDTPEEELHIAIPEIIHSLRGPSVERFVPSPEPEVPVEAYEAMLDHLKHVLEAKKPNSTAAVRHQNAIYDADIIEEEDVVVETEEYMLDPVGDDEESIEDDFADEEPITPSNYKQRQSDDGEDGEDDPVDDEVDDDASEVDLSSSFRLRHLCGDGFRGQFAVNPSTGEPLFPSRSVSRHTNEFQLRVLLEKRMGVVALDAVTLQLQALTAGSPMEAKILGEVRQIISTHMGKLKRCNPSLIPVQEVNEAIALCSQLIFFEEE